MAERSRPPVSMLPRPPGVTAAGGASYGSAPPPSPPSLPSRPSEGSAVPSFPWKLTTCVLQVLTFKVDKT
jgi:hypothetical protein